MAAAAIAKRTGSELTLLHVLILPVAVSGGEVIVMSEEQEERLRAQAEGLLGAIEKDVSQQGVKVSTVILEHRESVVSSIVGYASKQGTDLIVVGSRGLGGFKKLLLGSVADGLLRYSPCSVLIVR